MNGLGRKNENSENKQSIFTRETFGVVLILFATLSLVCLITGDSLFSAPGKMVASFLYGCFGFFAYAVVVWTIAKGVLLIADKKLNASNKRKTLITLFFILVSLLSHVISMSGETYSYGEYLTQCYNRGADGLATATGGGVFTGLVAYAFSTLLTNVGSYVILSVAIAVVGYFLVIDFIKPKAIEKQESIPKFKSSYVDASETIDSVPVTIEGVMDYPVNDVAFTNNKPSQKLFVNNPEDFSLKTKREMAKDNGKTIKLDLTGGGITMVNSPDSYTKTYGNEIKSKIDYIKTPASIDVQKTVQSYNATPSSTQATTVSDYVNVREEKQPIVEEKEIPLFEHEGSMPLADDSAKSHAEHFMSSYADIGEVETTANDYEPAETFHPITEEQSIVEQEQPNASTFNVEKTPTRDDIFRPFAPQEERVQTAHEEEIVDATPVLETKQDFVEPIKEEVDTVVEEEPPVSSIIRDRRTLFGDQIEKEEIKNVEANETQRPSVMESGFTERRSRMFDVQPASVQPAPEVKPESKPEPKPEKLPVPINRKYNKPPFDLLETHAQPINAGQENHQERMEIIQKTLEEFHINAVPQSYIQGPSITRYEIMMPAGVSVKKVLNYDDDLKMRLSAKEGVRIEAPIPGKNLVGVEVANTVKTMVGFREVMEGLAEKQQKKGSLWFAIGKDIVGNSISYDLAKGPHYLIAGATGSGKSVCLHVMLVSLLMRYSPEELKLVLVDPKSVEFRKYEHIPHLLVDEIITEPKRVLTLLQWAYDETNRRNDMFTACGGEISNIDDYNSLIASDTVPKLPRIVFFIDELADLMENCKKDLEARIRMIAAKSRSAGIHLVLATQRPSVDVITGTIKANLPSRIALKVMTFADSQTILSEAGAEKLLGNGDMLYKDSSMGNYERYQGAYISGREITNVVNYIRDNNTAYFDDDVQEFLDNETKPKQEESCLDDGDGGETSENDTLFLKALWLAVNSGGISISLLQRRFRVGYARAGAIVDDMERKGFISANEGSKARRVLLTREEFINRFGTIEDDGF